MLFVYNSLLFLAIAATVSFLFGYFFGYVKGRVSGIDYGSAKVHRRLMEIMDHSGLYLTYANALKNEAQRVGMTEKQIEDLMEETEQIFNEIHAAENA